MGELGAEVLRFLLEAVEAGVARAALFLFAGVGPQGFGAPGLLLLFVGEGFPGLKGVVEVVGVVGFF